MRREGGIGEAIATIMQASGTGAYRNHRNLLHRRLSEGATKIHGAPYGIRNIYLWARDMAPPCACDNMNIHEHTWDALGCRSNSTCKPFNPEYWRQSFYHLRSFPLPLMRTVSKYKKKTAHSAACSTNDYTIKWCTAWWGRRFKIHYNYMYSYGNDWKFQQNMYFPCCYNIGIQKLERTVLDKKTFSRLWRGEKV